MENKNYKPESHFFVEPDKLADAASGNAAADAFGPINDKKYRTTAFVRTPDCGTSEADETWIKVFAICSGQFLIQPQTGDATKINIILKPEASYAPLKVKYFIYRGIRKDSIMDANNNLKGTLDANRLIPNFLTRVIKEYRDWYNDKDKVCPAAAIGYNTDSNFNTAQSIEEYFWSGVNMSCPMCNQGEIIGYFSGRIGLDIVLDNGTYEPECEEEEKKELFKLDLAFARLSDHVFDIGTRTTTRLKRYREHIHQFLDPAAFWGSHIDCGKILSRKSGMQQSEKVDNVSIYNELLKKFQNKTKLYIYIQGEYGRSFGYYNANYTVDPSDDRKNETDNWPILIKEIVQNSAYAKEQSIIVGVPSALQSMIIDVHLFNNKINNNNNYPEVIDAVSHQLKLDLPEISLNGTTVRPATFCMIFAAANSGTDYYNNLWPANIKNSIVLGNDTKHSWFTYDKNRMVNLSPVLSCGAAIQNKVVCDKPNNIQRRLYMAIVKENTAHTDSLNVDSVTAGFCDNITTETYGKWIYKNANFSLLKGKLPDGTTDVLAFTNESDHFQVKSYFQLGITEAEYEFIIAPLNAPNETRCNAFFYLDKEEPATPVVFQKFKLGIRYEDSAGNMSEPVYPTDTIYIYTLDGHFFCSPEYAKLQNFTKAAMGCKVTFERKSLYWGYFGFDWMRLGTTTVRGDVNYQKIIGKLYTTTGNNYVDDVNRYKDTKLVQSDEEFYKLEQEYDWNFMLFDNKIAKYYIPELTIYPPYIDSPDTPERNPVFGYDNMDKFSIDNSKFTAFYNTFREGKLVIKISGNPPNNIRLQYDTKIFNISDERGKPVNYIYDSLSITIKCLKHFDKDQWIHAQTFRNANDKTGQIVGSIRVKANNKQNRYSKKVLIVGVTTSLRAAEVTNRSWKRAKKAYMRSLIRFLRQVLITPIIEIIDDISLTETPSSEDSNYFVKDGAKTYILAEDQSRTTQNRVEDYLFTKIPDNNKYQSYFKIFLFDTAKGLIKLPDGTVDTSFGGYSNNIDKMNVFSDFDGRALSNSAKIAHEFLHTAKVDHTFTNNSPHTFEPLATDNIMDYSNLNDPPTPRVSVFNWQGRIAYKWMDPDPQQDPLE